jgi:hypothetical protein
LAVIQPVVDVIVSWDDRLYWVGIAFLEESTETVKPVVPVVV